MDHYPEGLLKAVAGNLLKKKNGKAETESILKEAAEQLRLSPDQQRQAFLQQYKLKEDQFRGDPEAQKFVNSRVQASQQQVKDFYKAQRQNGMMDPDQLNKAEREMLGKIQEQSKGVAERVSIDRTRRAAQQSPEEFNKFHNLSAQSENALGQSHGREAGATVGALAGGALGLLGGRRLPKNTKGLLQQAGGAAAGGAIGGITGGAIGSSRDEKRTGFNHEDVMKPYEIATRMSNQQQFR